MSFSIPVTHTPAADKSAEILTRWLRSGLPFFFARIGDGAIECMGDRRRAAVTCDGEEYTAALRLKLENAITLLKASAVPVLWGDWRTACRGSAPTYTAEWEKLLAQHAPRHLVDYEALLLNRDSAALRGFYQAVREDPRLKLIVGSPRNHDAGRLLNAQYLDVGTKILAADIQHLRDEIAIRKPGLVLFGAGMAGLCAVVDYFTWNRQVPCIHLGSALDPLFQRPTRAGQLSREKAWQVFA